MKSKFKVDQIVQHIRTKAIYRIIKDESPLEPCSQRRLSSITEKEYTLYKVKTSKKMKEYYETLRNTGS